MRREAAFHDHRGGGVAKCVDQADSSWRYGHVALDGSGELAASERAFHVGVEEVLKGCLVDEQGGYRWLAAGGVVVAPGVVELDAGRSGAPAGAGTAEESSDGLRVRSGGVGVVVGTNHGEVVGRGVVVGECVDRGEGGLSGGSMAPAFGRCFAPCPSLRVPGAGDFREEEGRGR